MIVISELEANRLLDEENYFSDVELINGTFDTAKLVLDQIEDWPEREFSEEDWKQHEEFCKGFLEATNSYMEANHETHIIDVNYDPNIMGLMVKPHAVYRVIPTVRSVIGNILVIIRMIGMTTVTFSIEAAIVGQQVSEVIKKIIDGYVSIDDENDRKVFEAILKLRAELVVINYDALHDKDYEKAYGKIDPSEDRIIEYVKDSLSKDNAKKSIGNLIDMGVITKTRRGFKLVF